MKNDGDAATRHRREIVTALDAQIAFARELRKVSQDLIQQTADLREFVREQLLASFSKREHRAKE